MGDQLDLEDLSRLERKTHSASVGLAPGLLNLTVTELDTVGSQLRPLLDLVDALAKELGDLQDKHIDYPYSSLGEPDTLTVYRRAKGQLGSTDLPIARKI